MVAFKCSLYSRRFIYLFYCTQSLVFELSFLFKCKTSIALITNGNESNPLNKGTCKDNPTFKQCKMFGEFIF